MKKKKLTGISDCCKKDIRIEGVDDFDKQCTMYYVCTYCLRPCNTLISTRKQWDINPATKIKKDERQKTKEKEVKKEIEYYI